MNRGEGAGTVKKSGPAGRAPGGVAARDAVGAILNTADVVRRRLSTAIVPHGLTSQQYNVLRILRGQHPDPLPTLEIAERMIERTPGITRLLDRLEGSRLVRRERSADDRRLVHCWIAPAGLELLAKMDDAVDAANRRAMGALDADAVATLLELLERMRR